MCYTRKWDLAVVSNLICIHIISCEKKNLTNKLYEYLICRCKTLKIFKCYIDIWNIRIEYSPLFLFMTTQFDQSTRWYKTICKPGIANVRYNTFIQLLRLARGSAFRRGCRCVLMNMNFIEAFHSVAHPFYYILFMSAENDWSFCNLWRPSIYLSLNFAFTKNWIVQCNDSYKSWCL